MKTKSMILSALVVMSVVFSATAKEPSTAGFAVVPVSGSSVYKVVYKSENVGKVKLSLYNASAQLIFSESLNSKTGFIRPLNFDGLTSGEYTIEIEDATGKQTEKVSFAPVKSSVKFVHVSKLASEEGKYLLSVVGNSNNVVSIRIFNGSDLIFNESKEISNEFAQVYNVKAFTGNLSFEVTDSTGNVSTVNF
jgi:hypothetical protein